MKRSQIAIAVGVVVLAWVAVVPGIVGMRAEADFGKFDQDALGSSSLPISTKLASFQRGWFSSTAKTEYAISMGAQPVRLAVTHQVNQFAIPFYRWAKITHTIALVDDKGVETPLPVKLNASSDKLFFGGLSTSVAAPEIDWQNQEGLHIVGKNLNLNFHGKSGETQKYELNLPSLSAISAGTQINVNLSNLNLSGTYKDEKSATDTWKQDGHIKVDSIEATRNGNAVLKLQNLVMDTDLKDHGNNFDLVYQTKIDKSLFGDANGVVADEIHFDFSYLNLNKDGLLKIQAASKAFYEAAAKAPPVAGADVAAVAAPAAGDDSTDAKLAQKKAQMAMLMQHAGELAASSPGFRIDRFSLKTPNGEVAGTFEVNLDGKGLTPDALTGNNVMALLKEKISGKGSLTLARDVFLNAFEQKNAAAPAQRQMKENQLKMYVNQGYLKDDGKQLSLESTFGPQGVVVNGKRIM